MTTKHFLASAAAVFVSGALSFSPGVLRAADTQAAWEGFVETTAASSGCSGVPGATVGDLSVSIYRPKISGADTNTFLSFIRLRAALDLQNTSEATASQMNGTGNYSGDAIDNRAKSFTYNSTYKFTVTPFPITATTNTIKITGTFNNFYNNAGCNLTIEGVYMPRVF
jgi:hypothetical protein